MIQKRNDQVNWGNTRWGRGIKEKIGKEIIRNKERDSGKTTQRFWGSSGRGWTAFPTSMQSACMTRAPGSLTMCLTLCTDPHHHAPFFYLEIPWGHLQFTVMGDKEHYWQVEDESVCDSPQHTHTPFSKHPACFSKVLPDSENPELRT